MTFFSEWVSALWMIAKVAGALFAVLIVADYAAAAGTAYFVAFLALTFSAFIAWERVTATKPSIKGPHE